MCTRFLCVLWLNMRYAWMLVYVFGEISRVWRVRWRVWRNQEGVDVIEGNEWARVSKG